MLNLPAFTVALFAVASAGRFSPLGGRCRSRVHGADAFTARHVIVRAVAF